MLNSPARNRFGKKLFASRPASPDQPDKGSTGWTHSRKDPAPTFRLGRSRFYILDICVGKNRGHRKNKSPFHKIIQGFQCIGKRDRLSSTIWCSRNQLPGSGISAKTFTGLRRARSSFL